MGVVLAVASLLFAAVVAMTSSEPKLALLPVALALAIYVASRAVGWVLAGFIGSDEA